MVKKKVGYTWIIIMMVLWLGSLLLMIHTNLQRAEAGIETYYSDGLLITLNNISTSVFSAMTFAIAVGIIVNRALKQMKIK